MFVRGDKGVKLVECVHQTKDVWAVRWNVQADETEYEGPDGEKYVNENAVTYQSVNIDHKPTMNDVMDIVYGWYNEEIDAKILSGFTWTELNSIDGTDEKRTFSVWLSSENQFNYKVAYDLAVQSGNETLETPVVFKFGDNETTQYKEFTTLAELKDFYTKAASFVQATLADGWQTKNMVSFDEYKEYL